MGHIFWEIQPFLIGGVALREKSIRIEVISWFEPFLGQSSLKAQKLTKFNKIGFFKNYW